MAAAGGSRTSALCTWLCHDASSHSASHRWPSMVCMRELLALYGKSIRTTAPCTELRRRRPSASFSLCPRESQEPARLVRGSAMTPPAAAPCTGGCTWCACASFSLCTANPATTTARYAELLRRRPSASCSLCSWRSSRTSAHCAYLCHYASSPGAVHRWAYVLCMRELLSLHRKPSYNHGAVH